MNLDTEGPAAPPRRNGEIVFDEPWQALVFAMAAVVVDRRFGGDWGRFRRLLLEEIKAEPDEPYWENWFNALEELVVCEGILRPGEIGKRLLGES